MVPGTCCCRCDVHHQTIVPVSPLIAVMICFRSGCQALYLMLPLVSLCPPLACYVLWCFRVHKHEAALKGLQALLGTSTAMSSSTSELEKEWQAGEAALQLQLENHREGAVSRLIETCGRASNSMYIHLTYNESRAYIRAWKKGWIISSPSVAFFVSIAAASFHVLRFEKKTKKTTACVRGNSTIIAAPAIQVGIDYSSTDRSRESSAYFYAVCAHVLRMNVCPDNP